MEESVIMSVENKGNIFSTCLPVKLLNILHIIYTVIYPINHNNMKEIFFISSLQLSISNTIFVQNIYCDLSN